jgi:hypothetical protein
MRIQVREKTGKQIAKRKIFTIRIHIHAISKKLISESKRVGTVKEEIIWN